MKNYTLNDKTQKLVLDQLEKTEILLSMVATKLSKSQKSACIYAMPDLGIAHNCTRMIGGFFTGALYTWNTDVPFIPVDSTVNVCGCAIYKLSSTIQPEEFFKRIQNVMSDKSKYNWNYGRGNHFISLLHSDGTYNLEEGFYVIVHASAGEFKNELYPVVGNWYYNKIKTCYLDDNSRYIRYISGNDAEKFYQTAHSLLEFNENRNRYFCEKSFGNLITEEILSVPHYGMPNINSVAIGCQWKGQIVPLLTSPGEDIYVLENPQNNLTPHGFGLCLPENSNFSIESKQMLLGNKTFGIGDSITIGVDAVNRQIPINQILDKCNGKIYGRLEQICSFSQEGYKIWK